MALALALSGASPLFSQGHAPDEFYVARLRDGKQLLELKRPAEAVDPLRIATFGFLDYPAQLEEGLVLLALAQSGAGQTADTEATVTRFVMVEQRFATYRGLPLGPDSRTAFEALLRRIVREDALAQVPSLKHLVDTDEQKLAKLPPKERIRALEQRAQSEPANPAWPLALAREAAAQGEPKSAISWAQKVLQIDQTNVEARAIRGSALVVRKSYAAALEDLKALPPQRFDADPALRADLFVALAGAKDWDTARTVLESVREEDRARKDVAAAARSLPKEKSAPAAEEPSRAGASGSAPADAAVSSGPAPGSKQASAPNERAASGGAVPADAGVTAGQPPAAEARALQQQGKIAEARALLTRELEKDPRNREARKALLESAYLTKEWKLCAAYVKRLEPFDEGEEPAMFYAAVALWETGRDDQAKEYLRRARPKIASNPFVDYYTKRILGKP